MEMMAAVFIYDHIRSHLHFSLHLNLSRFYFTHLHILFFLNVSFLFYLISPSKMVFFFYIKYIRKLV